MLHYSTRDIITRARELADLENSNFITWAENMKLLDECYKKLYQESINANDKYYLTKCETKDLVVAEREERAVSYYLPEDFYQLQSISVKGTGRQILKKAKTEDNSSARYDIINNTLVLYGGTASLPLEIAYYPVPKTLTLKNDTVSVSTEGTVLDVNGNMVLSVKDNNAILTNINTGWTKSIDITSIDTTTNGNVVMGLLGLTRFYLLTEYARGYMIDIADGTVSARKCFVGRRDGVLFYSDKNWENWTPSDDGYIHGNIRSEWGDLGLTDPVTSFKTAADFPPMGFFFTLDDELNTYWSANAYPPAPGKNYVAIYRMNADGTLTEIAKEKFAGGSGWNALKIQFIKGHLFYYYDGPCCDGVTLLPYTEFSLFIGFNKMDFDTGYGFSVIPNYEENTMQIHSCFADTELDFPNNFYFSYLAYLMAIAYKQKQNADASMLIQRANDEYAQFLTSISRDVAENNRIQNVYGGGTYFYG